MLAPRLASLTLAALLVPAAAVLPQTGADASSRVLRRARVDCDAGQSLAAALLLPGDDLEISVQGICRESLTIRRDSVALVGGDPLRDGLRPPDGTTTEAVVVVRSARGVRLEGLSLAGSSGDGLRVVAAPEGVTLSSCRLEGNAGWGARIIDSEVTLERTVLTGNGSEATASGGGLLLTRGSTVSCTECVIGDNPATGANPGVALLSGSRLTARESTLEGSTAITAELHSTAALWDSVAAGADWAIEASYESEIFVHGGELLGPFLAADRSAIQLFGVDQSYNPAQNFVTESSTLLCDDRAAEAGGPVATRLEGLTMISDFSTAKLIDASVAGELACRLGSDAFCDGSESKVLSDGCGRCP